MQNATIMTQLRSKFIFITFICYHGYMHDVFDNSGNDETTLSMPIRLNCSSILYSPFWFCFLLYVFSFLWPSQSLVIIYLITYKFINEICIFTF